MLQFHQEKFHQKSISRCSCIAVLGIDCKPSFSFTDNCLFYSLSCMLRKGNWTRALNALHNCTIAQLHIYDVFPFASLTINCLPPVNCNVSKVCMDLSILFENDPSHRQTIEGDRLSVGHKLDLHLQPPLWKILFCPNLFTFDWLTSGFWFVSFLSHVSTCGSLNTWFDDHLCNQLSLAWINQLVPGKILITLFVSQLKILGYVSSHVVNLTLHQLSCSVGHVN